MTITRHHKKGRLAGVKLVRDIHELMLISVGGVVIRVPVTGISKLSRATQGVRIMNLTGDDRVCSVARVQISQKKRAKADSMVEDDQHEPTPEEEAEEALAQEAEELELLSEAEGDAVAGGAASGADDTGELDAEADDAGELDADAEEDVPAGEENEEGE